MHPYPIFSKDELCEEKFRVREDAPFLTKKIVPFAFEENETIGILKPELFPSLYEAVEELSARHGIVPPPIALEFGNPSNGSYEATSALGHIKVTTQFLGRHGLLPERDEQGGLSPVTRPVSDVAKSVLSHELIHQKETLPQRLTVLGSMVAGGALVQLGRQMLQPLLPKSKEKGRFTPANLLHALFQGVATAATIAGAYLGYVAGMRIIEQRTDRLNNQSDDRIAGGNILAFEQMCHSDELVVKQDQKPANLWDWYKSLFIKAYQTHDPHDVRLAKVTQHNPQAEAAAEQIRQEAAPTLHMERCNVELEAAAANANEVLKGQINEGTVIWPKAASIQAVLIDPAQRINEAGRKALDNFAQAVCHAEQARNQLALAGTAP